MFKQERDAVRHFFLAAGKHAKQFLKRLRSLRHKRHDKRAEQSVADTNSGTADHFSLTRPELSLEVRVDDIVKQVGFASVFIGKTKRKRIAGDECSPVTACQFRYDARSDFTKSVMRSERKDQQIGLPKRIKNSGSETAVGIVKRVHGSGDLLTAYQSGSFFHGIRPFLESFLFLGIGQDSKSCPKNDPAGFAGAVAVQSTAPVVQKITDMEAEILSRELRRSKKSRYLGGAGLGIVFKDKLDGMARLRHHGLEFFRQRGNDAGELFCADVFQRAFQTKDADKAAVIGDKHVAIDSFKAAVAVNRAVEKFGHGSCTAFHSINNVIEHQKFLA